jgi:tetratricopeptide (TPR) repeat protein
MSGPAERRLSDAASYQAFVAEVSALVDTDPRRAVEVAEATTCIPALEPLLRQVQAYAFTHSGEIIGDEDLVRRGGEIWRSLARPGDPHGTYNIANAEAPLFEIVARRDGYAEAMLNRRANLRRARAMHLEIGDDESVDTDLRLQSLTNCANLYDGVARNIESLACYQAALDLDPGFGMALGNRAIAHAAYASLTAHPSAMVQLAARDFGRAFEDSERIVAIGGERSLRHFREVSEALAVTDVAEPWGSEPAEWHDPHQRWCLENSLFLTLSHECLHPDDDHLDAVFPRRFSGGPERKDLDHIDDLIDAFNSLKQEYISARYLIWLSLEPESPIREQAGRLGDAAAFHDSLQVARWGIRTGLSMLAFTAVTNLLDKVASFVHLYYATGRGNYVYFRGFWRGDRRKGDGDRERLMEAFEPHLSATSPNSGLLALWDLSCDLEEETLLGRLLQLRHAATHRFLVAHHGSTPGSGDLLERIEWFEFRAAMVEQLKVARAAIFYLVRLVDSHEQAILSAEEKAGRSRPELPIPTVEPQFREID